MYIDIIGGIVSGVASGVVLAIFFWSIGIFRQRSERKEQIQYLACLITTHRERMYKPAYLPNDPVESDIGKDIFRKTQFERMKNEVGTALDGRCSRLSFDEINHLRRILDNWSAITDEWKATKLNWTDVFCGKLFGELDAIKWLGLPKGPDFYRSGDHRTNSKN